MLEEAGAVKIPIKDMDKPDLRLVVNNEPIEINFKNMKPNNPLW